MNTRFARFVMDFPGRLAMPIGAYAGAEIMGGTVQDVVSRPEAQFAAGMALHERFRTPVLLTAMDLSAEAETFGCEIRMSEHEIPTVVGRRVVDAEGITSLAEPDPGDARTRVPLETASAGRDDGRGSACVRLHARPVFAGRPALRCERGARSHGSRA